MVKHKIILLLILLSFSLPLNADEQILAVVNNDVITSKDLEDFSNFMRLQLLKEKDSSKLEEEIQRITPQLLEKLIEDRLILQEAKRQKIDIDRNIIQKRLDEIKKRYPDERSFYEALNTQGLTLADLENRIREQLLIYNAVEKNVKSKIVIHPEEVTAYYQNYPDNFFEPEKRKVVAAVFQEQTQAQEILQLLKEKSLQDLIKENSIQIKELGTVTKGELKEEFDSAVFNLEKGQYSDILKLDDKYYIFWVEEITPSQKIPFSESKHIIYTILLEKKTEEALKRWVDELRKKSYIQVKKD